MNMIFIYVQIYPNIHKAAITNTQSVHIHIHNPQSQPTTRLIQVSCWHPSNKCYHKRQTYSWKRRWKQKESSWLSEWLSAFTTSPSGDVEVGYNHRAKKRKIGVYVLSWNVKFVFLWGRDRIGSSSKRWRLRTVSCRDKELINSGYELEALSWDLRKCQNLTSIVGKKLSTKG